MRKLLSFTLVLAGLAFFTSCGDDDEGGNNITSGDVSISGIPAAAQVAQGDVLVVTGVTLEAENGFASFELSIDGGSPVDLSSLITEGETSATVDIEFNTDGLSTGLRTLVFTLTDVNGESVQVQHGLTVAEFGIVDVDGNITEDTEWTKNNVYRLNTRVTVESGATLDIEEGTIIKGAAGTGANATALLVARGATLNAVGTATEPIIMTSVADNIEPGEINSPNMDESISGLWGGLIVLGNAKISASADEVQIEGIPTSDTNGLYGGDDDADNSGTIQYVSVRHGGSNIGAGNEINGITFGGAGSGTTAGWLEVVGNQDDGLEFFGGTVSVENALVWSNGDDAFDTDQAWAGTVDNGVVVSAGDSPFELDGPEGDYEGAGHTLTNFTVYVKGNGAEEMIDVDENTDVTLNNVLFFGLEISEDGTTPNKVSSDYIDYVNNGDDAVTSLEAVIPADYVDEDGDTQTSSLTKDDFFGDAAGEVTVVDNVGAATVGADISAFSFTWASQSGALSSLGLE